jgi:transposase
VIQITPQMRVLVALEPADFRCGIDGLARRCRSVLREDPFSGAVIVFRNRTQKAIKMLVYDGQGFWLCQKRLSRGKFRFWPSSANAAVSELLAHEFQVLIFGGDPALAQGAPVWREVKVRPAVGMESGACVP